MNVLISSLIALLGAIIGGVVGPAISWILRPSGNGISLHEIRAIAGSGRLVNETNDAARRIKMIKITTFFQL